MSEERFQEHVDHVRLLILLRRQQIAWTPTVRVCWIPTREKNQITVDPGIKR